MHTHLHTDTDRYVQTDLHIGRRQTYLYTHSNMCTFRHIPILTNTQTHRHVRNTETHSKTHTNKLTHSQTNAQTDMKLEANLFTRVGTCRFILIFIFTG
jgi:hypothetical protein